MDRRERIELVLRAIANKQSMFFNCKKLAYDIDGLCTRGVGSVIPDLKKKGLIRRWNEEPDKPGKSKAGVYERLFKPCEVNNIINKL